MAEVEARYSPVLPYLIVEIAEGEAVEGNVIECQFSGNEPIDNVDVHRVPIGIGTAGDNSPHCGVAVCIMMMVLVKEGTEV